MTAVATATPTLNAAASPTPLRAFEEIAAAAGGTELFRSDVVSDGTATYRTPPFPRDACVTVVGSVSSSGLRVTVEPELTAPAGDPGALLRVPGVACARTGESLTVTVRGTGTARLVLAAR